MPTGGFTKATRSFTIAFSTTRYWALNEPFLLTVTVDLVGLDNTIRNFEEFREIKLTFTTSGTKILECLESSRSRNIELCTLSSPTVLIIPGLNKINLNSV